MPARVARSSVGAPQSVSKNKKAKNKNKKRTLNAYAIASAEQPEVLSKSHRLGETAEDDEPRKRRRGGSEELDDEDDGPGPSKKRSRRGPMSDAEEESDSDGNRWTLGVVGEDDDSDIDSDEAFDEEDEERFAGFSFGGSGGSKVAKRKSNKSSGGLDEEEDLDDDDSLGEDAIDLAQMLDNYDEDNNEDEDAEESTDGGDEASESESDEEDNNDVFSNSSFSDDEDVDEDQLGKLHSLVESLHPSKSLKNRDGDVHESVAPTAAGPTATEKFNIQDLLASSDPQLVKMTKKLGTLPKVLKKDPKLAPSLPKREKDRIDRIAATTQANQTLERWTDSVKHMRRAEHLQFPLQDSETPAIPRTQHILPAITSRPLNALESTISNILEESGLAPEEDEETGDELPDNNVTVQEVLARRAELRRARELIFREEKRAKRIKKIKSKSYRRVHRKERERMAALENDDGSEMDEEDREAHDRRRAEERMGTKHRDSKWAKQMKKSGRTVWDDEARGGVVEQARRGEELRRRIGGKMEGGSSEESSDEDGAFDEDDEEGKAASEKRARKKLDDLANDSIDPRESKLAGMQFMLKAEKALKDRNEKGIAQMRRLLDGGESSEESETEQNVGRKLFGPTDRMAKNEVQEQRTEFEEPDWSEDDNVPEENGPIIDPTQSSVTLSRGSFRKNAQEPKSKVASLPANSNAKATNTTPGISLEGITSKPKATQKVSPSQGILSKPDSQGWVTVTYDHNSDKSDSDSEAESLASQSSILRRAFAGDDVEDEFIKEKTTAIADEDEKIVDETLAGWGSWVGEGISKRELKRAKGKVLSKQEGIRPDKRKDAKLKGVIINQKRVKRNTGYLASTVPFPFTSKAEYERAMRMPIGTEWNVKKAVVENTKPRVLVKPGAIVRPMEKPLV